MPQLKEHSEEAIMDYFASPECIPIIARNPMEQGDSLPLYIVPSISVVDYLRETGTLETLEPFCVKIIDFGNCKATVTLLVLICSLWYAQHLEEKMRDRLPILQSLPVHRR